MMDPILFHPILAIGFLDPFTWAAIISLAVAAAQAGMTYKQGKDAAEEQEAMADVHEAAADNERLTAQYAAEQEEQRRLSERRAERSDQKRRRAAMEASYAKSGVAFKGTPSAMVAEQFKVDEYNLMMGDQASHEDEKQVLWQGENRAINEMNQAKQYKAEARNTMKKANVGLAMDVAQMGLSFGVGAAMPGTALITGATNASKIAGGTAGAAGGNAGGAFGGMLGDALVNSMVGNVSFTGTGNNFGAMAAGQSVGKAWRNRGNKKLAPRINDYGASTYTKTMGYRPGNFGPGDWL